MKSTELICNTLTNKVRQLWSMILNHERLPDSDSNNFFLDGGSILTFVQLFNEYESCFASSKKLNILEFFIEPTIVDHVRLLSNRIDSEPSNISCRRVSNQHRG